MHAKGKKFAWEKLQPYMALVKLPKVRDYWRKGSQISVHFLATIMSRDRLIAISRTVHMSNPEHNVVNDRKKGTPEYNRLQHLQPLYTSMKLACKALWQPRKQIAINERMVATKDKIGLRQYMKAKPSGV